MMTKIHSSLRFKKTTSRRKANPHQVCTSSSQRKSWSSYSSWRKTHHWLARADRAPTTSVKMESSWQMNSSRLRWMTSKKCTSSWIWSSALRSQAIESATHRSIEFNQSWIKSKRCAQTTKTNSNLKFQLSSDNSRTSPATLPAPEKLLKAIEKLKDSLQSLRSSDQSSTESIQTRSTSASDARYMKQLNA